MIITLSPSKGQDFESEALHKSQSVPVSLSQSEMLINELRHLDSDEIRELMSVSENIAKLNVDRFKSFSTPFTPENAKPAIYAFKGDVYGGMDVDNYTQDDLAFAQAHLRILSGLYGALRPMDLIQPYRLEMKTKLANPRGDNLYQFWDTRITELLNDALSEQQEATMINLASNEYFKSVKPKLLKGRLLQVNFKEEKNGKARVIAIFAKRARGRMADYLIKHRIEHSEQVKDFDLDGYRYNDVLSDDKQWTFTRPQPAKKT